MHLFGLSTNARLKLCYHSDINMSIFEYLSISTLSYCPDMLIANISGQNVTLIKAIRFQVTRRILSRMMSRMQSNESHD